MAGNAKMPQQKSIPQQQQQETKNPPVKKFRAGGIVLSIWENQMQGRDGNPYPTNSFVLDRSYKDKEGNWKRTSSMRAHDLVKVRLLIDKAIEFAFLKEEGTAVSQEDEEEIVQ